MASQVNSIKRLVAYFSMEIALENAMPSYSGGLGVLAGDTNSRRCGPAAAHGGHLPALPQGILHPAASPKTARKPKNRSSASGRLLDRGARRASVSIENRRVELRCWRYSAKGVRGFEVPIYFLDADLPSNADADAISPALCMAAILTTVCARKSCWESEASAFFAHSATTTSRATT